MSYKRKGPNNIYEGHIKGMVIMYIYEGHIKGKVIIISKRLYKREGQNDIYQGNKNGRVMMVFSRPYKRKGPNNIYQSYINKEKILIKFIKVM